MKLSTKLIRQDNPWQEDTQDRAKHALATVMRTRLRATILASHLPGMKRELQRFDEDLCAIEKAYREDAGLFRQNRALTTVHLPAIASSLETLAKLQQGGEAADKISAITEDIKACLGLARDARVRLDKARLDALAVETSVLKDALDPSPEVAATPVSVPAAEKPDLAGRLGSLAAHRGVAFRTAIGDAGNAALDRIGSGAGVAATFVSGAIEEGVDRISSPITQRASALATAITDVSISALAGGVISAVIFPPAVPIAMGLAILEGSSRYEKALEAQEEEAGEKRRQRKDARQTKLQAQLNKIKGRSPVVSMQTGHVYVTLNAETGASNGIILTGRYAGQALGQIDKSDLTVLAKTAPDDETRRILDAWIQRDLPDANDPCKAGKPRDEAGASVPGMLLDLLVISAL